MSYPPPTDTPPYPAPARPRPWLWIGAGALAFVASAGGAFALASDPGPSRAEQAVAAQPGPAATTRAVAQAAPTPTSGSYTPKPDDFRLTAKITGKECFGEAGCSVNFRVDLGYRGQALDDSTTWLVVYEILGVEDAPQVGNLKLTGANYTGREENVDTESTRSKITLKVTSVDKN